MVEDRIVKNDNSGRDQRPVVDVFVKLVVAGVIEVNVGLGGIHFHPPPVTQRGEECRSVVGDPGGRRRQRSMETDLQAFFRGPNNAVPTRTWVAPSSIAVSRS